MNEVHSEEEQMLHHPSGIVRGFKHVGFAMAVTLATGIIMIGCAAPTQAPAAGSSAASAPAEQPAPTDAGSDNRPIEYVVVDKLSTSDTDLLKSAYIMAPPSESLGEVLKELGRTDTDHLGVLIPYEIGLEQGLNGAFVIPATGAEMPGTLGELTFADPLFAESGGRSFLFEFDDSEALTATSPANVDLDVFGSFFYTQTVPDLGSVSPDTFTVPGTWVDYCAEHPVECRGAEGDPQDVCGCGYWYFDPYTWQLVWICQPCD